jgi:hypothetical protein
MAVIIKDKKVGFKHFLKKKCKVIEVTIKQYYITYPHEPLTEEQIKNEWFGTHLNKSHAYKDGSHVGGADEVVEVKFLTKDDLKTINKK